MIRALIMWMVRRNDGIKTPIVQWKKNVDPANRLKNEREGTRQVVAHRYAPFLPDEHTPSDGAKVYWKLPRWAPCNALLHHWRTHEDEQMHDHARWSITVVLKGELIERTPWGERRLRAGSVVLRSTHYIHGFRCDREHSARTWTLFIVGRRKSVQNTYAVVRRFEAPNRGVA